MRGSETSQARVCKLHSVSRHMRKNIGSQDADSANGALSRIECLRLSVLVFCDTVHRGESSRDVRCRSYCISICVQNSIVLRTPLPAEKQLDLERCIERTVSTQRCTAHTIQETLHLTRGLL